MAHRTGFRTRPPAFLARSPVARSRTGLCRLASRSPGGQRRLAQIPPLRQRQCRRTRSPAPLRVVPSYRPPGITDLRVVLVDSLDPPGSINPYSRDPPRMRQAVLDLAVTFRVDRPVRVQDAQERLDRVLVDG